MSRVDLKLGFACNNRCVFCVQGDKRKRHGPRSIDRIRVDLEEGRRRGRTGLVLTGGEPTVDSRFLEVTRLAKRLGYTLIQIQTNGRLFVYNELCKAAIAAGANEFSPALHGSTPDIHDRLTSVGGSFEQTVSGIRNLVRLGQRVVTNTVITEQNRRNLPELARFLVSLGVHQFQLAFVHIVGTAAENAERLVPRKTAVIPPVREALEIGKAAGVRCMTEAIPYCLMDGYEDFVAEKIIPETQIFDADMSIDDYRAYRRNEGKAKGPRCHDCRSFEECEGPWREYPELFGWGEFQPIPVAR